MIDQTNRRDAYRTVFDSAQGKEVLEDIEATVRRNLKLGIREIQGKANPAYLNPYAALWHFAQMEVVDRIWGLISDNTTNND
mgnify:CR=1 FL=1